MIIHPPAATESFGFYDAYINRARHTDMFAALEAAHKETLALLTSLSPEMHNYRYAEGKWSIKEIVQHLMDAERNFCIRAMRFSRGDKGVIPPYNDITTFVQASMADGRTMDDLLEEWEMLRKATLIQYRTFTPQMLDLTGPMRDVEVSVRALGFLMAGHEMHHISVIKEKYLGQQAS